MFKEKWNNQTEFLKHYIIYNCFDLSSEITFGYPKRFWGNGQIVNLQAPDMLIRTCAKKTTNLSCKFRNQVSNFGAKPEALQDVETTT